MNSAVSKSKILIVEDDEATAELERRSLVRSGMTVRIATGVKDALAALATETFDAILLDFNLPDGDSWTVVEAADLKIPRIPVIVVTAQGNELIASEALRRGVADYLKKTGTFWDQLPDALDRVTRLARVEQALTEKTRELIQTNIALEKRTEDLRRSEQRLVSLYDSTPALMYSVDVNGRMLTVSDALLKKIGYTRDEVLGHSSLEFLTEASREHAIKVVLPELFKTNHYENVSYQVVTKSGKILDVLLSGDLDRDADGHVVRSLEVIEDVTERLALERQLTQERKRLEYIIESTQAGSWEWNVQTGATIFNERWCEIIGYRLKDLEPISVATWLTYLHPDDQKKSDELLRRHFAEQSDHYECEIRMRHRDGHWVWVLSRGRVMTHTKEGLPEWMFGTHEDVTRRVAERELLKNVNAGLEQRVTERTAELESTLLKLHQSQEELIRSEAKAMLSMLAASVSHELNSPIGNSVLAAGTLTDLTRTIRAAIDNNNIKRTQLVDAMQDIDTGAVLIEKNLKRAEELLNSFRQVAADQSSERRRVFDLGATVQEVLDTLAPILKRQAGRIVMNIPGGILMDSEPGALGQIVINLINNACLHGFESRDDGVLDINAVADDKRVTLRFSDNGNGMSELTLKNLFQPFYSTKIGKGGTGLGMAIVKNLIKTLGGDIKVESEVGRGTSFVIRLPLVLPSAGERDSVR